MRILASSMLAGVMIPLTALSWNTGTLTSGHPTHHGHHMASTTSTSSRSTSTSTASTSTTTATRPFIAYSPDSFLKSTVAGAAKLAVEASRERTRGRRIMRWDGAGGWLL